MQELCQPRVGAPNENDYHLPRGTLSLERRWVNENHSHLDGGALAPVNFANSLDFWKVLLRQSPTLSDPSLVSGTHNLVCCQAPILLFWGKSYCIFAFFLVASVAKDLTILQSVWPIFRSRDNVIVLQHCHIGIPATSADVIVNVKSLSLDLSVKAGF
jgi:hypothetical protein